jgi:hypothetical protein
MTGSVQGLLAYGANSPPPPSCYLEDYDGGVVGLTVYEGSTTGLQDISTPYGPGIYVPNIAGVIRVGNPIPTTDAVHIKGYFKIRSSPASNDDAFLYIYEAAIAEPICSFNVRREITYDSAQRAAFNMNADPDSGFAGYGASVGAQALPLDVWLRLEIRISAVAGVSFCRVMDDATDVIVASLTIPVALPIRPANAYALTTEGVGSFTSAPVDWAPFEVCPFYAAIPAFGVKSTYGYGPVFLTPNMTPTLPDGIIAGDLILVAAWTGNTAGGPGSAAGYERVGYVNPGGGQIGFGVFARVATGTAADTCIIVNPGLGWASALSWVIAGASANSVGVVTDYTPDSGTAVAFPDVTDQEAGFLAIAAVQMATGAQISSWPSGYSNTVFAVNTLNGGSSAASSKYYSAGDAVTPGMTLVGGGYASSMTITVLDNAPSAARGVVDPLPIGQIGDDVLSPTNPSASLNVDNQGLISVTGNDSILTDPSRWFNPATSDIGRSYYFKLTVLSGSGPNTGPGVGVWLTPPMFNNYYGWLAGYTWTWSRTINGTTTAQCRLDVATSANDADIVASATFNVTVVRGL